MSFFSFRDRLHQQQRSPWQLRHHRRRSLAGGGGRRGLSRRSLPPMQLRSRSPSGRFPAASEPAEEREKKRKSRTFLLSKSKDFLSPSIFRLFHLFPLLLLESLFQELPLLLLSLFQSR